MSRIVDVEPLDCLAWQDGEHGTTFDDGVLWVLEKIGELPSAQPEQQHGRVFKGIVVEYPSYNIYPGCKGSPYFSIKYTENGQEFIGYGTYKPEVLSEYLKEYFMPSAQSEKRTKNARKTHACDCIERRTAIDAINSHFGFNIEEEYGSAVQEVINGLPSAQPQPIVRCKDCKYWMPYDWMFSEIWRSQNINDYTEDEIGCQYCDMAMKADDFCSRAERRTDE